VTTDLHVLRVFVGPDGRGGNPLGVFVDGSAIDATDRQAVAARLGFSETVFVDAIDREAATIHIYTPAVEMPFAGHPTVGTGWLLRHFGRSVTILRPPAGDVAVWQGEDGELAWIRARPDWLAVIVPVQFATPAEVDALTPRTLLDPSLYAWAWEDQAAGLVRSRSFPTEFGIIEDEATGLAAVTMGDLLGLPITIHQGVGSELHVRPDRGAGTVDVGGRVTLDEVRSFS
jgi:predicted PhzF superfamily epimerase YddE/YHI9